jgi:hypothetical protein
MTRRFPHCYWLFFVLASMTACASDAVIAPFTSDGCSDFPNGLPQHKSLWLNCCVLHDKTYWQGGTYKERRLADEALERCVAAVGQPEIAKLMLAGVRVGGSPFWPTHFRWGYGWSWLRGYGALTSVERAQAQAALAEYEKTFANKGPPGEGGRAPGKP